MTDATRPELYPQYCFHLSPTINRWCHFQIADILALRSHPGFQGQDVYFHHNHPIKWIRISGVVVAVDERETRNLYTIDDGSGATLECLVKVAPRAAPGTATAGAAAQAKPSPDSNILPVVDGPIDVGHVLDIKGSLGTFRDNKQIRAEKIVHLRSTEQEVVFWEKVAQLRQDVLSKPWVLDRREVRRCRKEEAGRSTHQRHRGNSGRHSNKRLGMADVEETKTPSEKDPRAHRGEGIRKSKQERKTLARRTVGRTGLEKIATNSVTRLIPVTGKYDTLGL